MKLRYADEAVKEIKQIDPSSAVTARMIRSLIKKQVIPSIPVGNGCRRLIDLGQHRIIRQKEPSCQHIAFGRTVCA